MRTAAGWTGQQSEEKQRSGQERLEKAGRCSPEDRKGKRKFPYIQKVCDDEDEKTKII